MIVRIGSASKAPPRGDFAADFDGGTLTLPSVFQEFVETSEIESAEDFLSLVSTYPQQLAVQLGWTEHEVLSALEAFAIELSRVAGVDYVSELRASRPSRPLGARTASGTRPSSSNPPSDHHKLG